MRRIFGQQLTQLLIRAYLQIRDLSEPVLQRGCSYLSVSVGFVLDKRIEGREPGCRRFIQRPLAQWTRIANFESLVRRSNAGFRREFTSYLK
jgi:hypothetical protein